MLVWVVGVSAFRRISGAETAGLAFAKAVLRMTIDDEGMVMPCGTGPDSCDTYGAREAVVVEHEGVYYFLRHDSAGKDGWLSCLATMRPAPLGEARIAIDPRRSVGRPDSGFVALVGERRREMAYVLRGHPPCTPLLIKSGYLLYADPDGRGRSSWPGPRRKRYDIIPFTNEAGTYYSDTASPGDVVEQDGEQQQDVFRSRGF